MVLKGPAHQEPVVSVMRAFSKGLFGVRAHRCEVVEERVEKVDATASHYLVQTT